MKYSHANIKLKSEVDQLESRLKGSYTAVEEVGTKVATMFDNLAKEKKLMFEENCRLRFEIQALN